MTTPDHAKLREYLEIMPSADPMPYPAVAAMLETCTETGHLESWRAHPGSLPPTQPDTRPEDILLDVWFTHPDTGQPVNRAPVHGHKVLTFVRGLLQDNRYADIEELQQEVSTP